MVTYSVSTSLSLSSPGPRWHHSSRFPFLIPHSSASCDGTTIRRPPFEPTTVLTTPPCLMVVLRVNHIENHKDNDNRRRTPENKLRADDSLFPITIGKEVSSSIINQDRSWPLSDCISGEAAVKTSAIHQLRHFDRISSVLSTEFLEGNQLFPGLGYWIAATSTETWIVDNALRSGALS